MPQALDVLLFCVLGIGEGCRMTLQTSFDVS